VPDWGSTWECFNLLAIPTFNNLDFDVEIIMPLLSVECTALTTAPLQQRCYHSVTYWQANVHGKRKLNAVESVCNVLC
jgi:hypothetical protein